MKRILLIVLLIWSLEGVAQNPQLFGHTWHLQQIVIDDEIWPYPFQGVASTVAFYDEDTFLIDFFGCAGTEQYQIAYSGIDVFTLSFSVGFDFQCGGVSPQVYNLHYEIYRQQISGLQTLGPFSYVISTENNHDFLVVTNINGDQAFYSDAALVVSDFDPAQIAVFFNPENDKLEFKGIYPDKLSQVTVYNQMGQAVLSDQQIQDGVDLGALPEGIYFANFSLNDGGMVSKKFLKY